MYAFQALVNWSFASWYKWQRNENGNARRGSWISFCCNFVLTYVVRGLLLDWVWLYWLLYWFWFACGCSSLTLRNFDSSSSSLAFSSYNSRGTLCCGFVCDGGCSNLDVPSASAVTWIFWDDDTFMDDILSSSYSFSMAALSRLALLFSMGSLSVNVSALLQTISSSLSDTYSSSSSVVAEVVVAVAVEVRWEMICLPQDKDVDWSTTLLADDAPPFEFCDSSWVGGSLWYDGIACQSWSSSSSSSSVSTLFSTNTALSWDSAKWWLSMETEWVVPSLSLVFFDCTAAGDMLDDGAPWPRTVWAEVAADVESLDLNAPPGPLVGDAAGVRGTQFDWSSSSSV